MDLQELHYGFPFHSPFYNKTGEQRGSSCLCMTLKGPGHANPGGVSFCAKKKNYVRWYLYVLNASVSPNGKQGL
jgi:hypothetical protein